MDQDLGQHSFKAPEEAEHLRAPLYAAERKTNKYTSLAQSYLFVAVAAETMGAINKDVVNFLSDLGRRIT